MADSAVTLERYVLEVCNSRWEPQGELRDADTLTFVERYCDVGTGAVNCPASDHNRALVERGSRILVKRNGLVEQAGAVVELGESDSVLMKLNWKDPIELLSDRLAQPDPTQSPDGAVFSREFDERAGFASTVILGYVEANAGQSALPDRRIAGLRIGADMGVGVKIEAPVQARQDNLLDLIRRVAVPSGVGFKITTFDGEHTLDVYEVSDLSESAVFSAETHGVLSSEWWVKPPAGTRVSVGGKGEGAARLFYAVSSEESRAAELVWNRRIELFRDDRNAEGDSLINGALRDLSEKGETVEATFTPSESGLEYGRDYRLGDLVTVVLRPGLTAIKPIREVQTKVSVAEGRQVTPVAGDYAATSSTGSAFKMREIIRVVEQLKKNR